MPKKPDRYERMLDKHTGDGDDWRARMIPAQRVVKLLRAEHVWMRRVVNKIERQFINRDLPADLGLCALCDELHKQLDKRRK